MDRREAIDIILHDKSISDSEMLEALDVAINIMIRAVPCKECEHAWFKQSAPAECPYYCTIGQHYHAPDFFCRNGKPKVDET